MNDSNLPHPAFEELLAISLDELPAPRAEAVREHLLDCPECLEQVRGLLALSDVPPTPDLAIGDPELSAAWQSLEKKLDRDGEAKDRRAFILLTGGGAVPSSAPESIWRGRSLAAILAAAVLGLAVGGFWAPARDRAIQSVIWTPLEPEGSYTRSGGAAEPRKLDCPADGDPFGVQFALASGETPKVALVRIADSAGKVVHGYEEAKLNELGIAGLAIRKSSLPNGRYVLLVQKETREAPVIQFPFRVECQP